jgi:hypothetical protein
MVLRPRQHHHHNHDQYHDRELLLAHHRHHQAIDQNNDPNDCQHLVQGNRVHFRVVFFFRIIIVYYLHIAYDAYGMLTSSASTPIIRSPLGRAMTPTRSSGSSFGSASRSPTRQPLRNVSTSHGRLIHQPSTSALSSSSSSASSPLNKISSSPYNSHSIGGHASSNGNGVTSPLSSTAPLPVAEGSRRIFQGAVPLNGTPKRYSLLLLVLLCHRTYYLMTIIVDMY